MQVEHSPRVGEHSDYAGGDFSRAGELLVSACGTFFRVGETSASTGVASSHVVETV